MTSNDEGSVEALCAIVTPAHEFREFGLLLDRSAVQSQEDARAILAAIRDGKVPGVEMMHPDQVCSARILNEQIASLRAQLAAAKAEGERAAMERAELRAALRSAAQAVGGGLSDDCSHAFHVAVADEVRLVREKMRQEVIMVHQRASDNAMHCAKAEAERDALAALLDEARDMIEENRPRQGE